MTLLHTLLFTGVTIKPHVILLAHAIMQFVLVQCATHPTHALDAKTKYKWQGPMQEAQNIRVVGGKDP